MNLRAWVFVGRHGQAEGELDELLEEGVAEAADARRMVSQIEGRIEVGDNFAELEGDGCGDLGAIEAENKDERVAVADDAG